MKKGTPYFVIKVACKQCSIIRYDDYCRRLSSILQCSRPSRFSVDENKKVTLRAFLNKHSFFENLNQIRKNTIEILTISVLGNKLAGEGCRHYLFLEQHHSSASQLKACS